MKWENVTIIGSGSGGCATAADLQLRGYNVTIYDLPEYQHHLFPLIESGKIKLTGQIGGVVPIANIVVEMEEAVNNADIILIITHAGSHEKIAHLLSPFVKDGQVIVLLPGYTGSTLCFHRIFKENNVKVQYLLAETNTLPYACRKIAGESAVHVKLALDRFWISTFPSRFNSRFMDQFQLLYPNAVLAENVFETGFYNGNPVLNVVPSIFNAGRIEFAQGEYYHFQEGVTPSIVKVMEQVDEERISIANALNIKTLPYLKRVKDTGYVRTNESWYNAISTSPHLTAKGPDKLNHRYLTEDVPYGLTPWYELGLKAGVEMKLISSMIQLSSVLLSEDYFLKGRKLTDMGIEHLSVNQIKQYLHEGE